MSHQPAILKPVPSEARFVTLELARGATAKDVLQILAGMKHDPRRVVGIGAPLVTALSKAVPGLRAFPTDLVPFPATQGALWAFFALAGRGEAFDAGRAFLECFRGALAVSDETDTFVYRKGRDLSGFEDGTENPKGKAAALAALVAGGKAPGLDGGSFVAVQRFVHDLAGLHCLSDAAQANVIGRRRKDNQELADAPPSAHVKRTAQESFDPPAFILRKSMPYGGMKEHGLYFVAFGESLDRFERILRRMAGRDDGITDGLLGFTRAVSGGYYFCPPVRNGKLDLRGIR
ncbi:MAG TPA: Dyp-type peroxidase [Polyangiaceae bacterium]|nr:Dyp-type peroxidase [Polyangiaceae bacterium]